MSLTSRNSRARGFTVVELFIGVSILAIFVLGVVWFILQHTNTFDVKDAAQEWAQSLEYHYVSSTCTNSLAEGRYVRCTVRVLEVKEPIPLECGVLSQKCSMMKVSR